MQCALTASNHSKSLARQITELRVGLVYLTPHSRQVPEAPLQMHDSMKPMHEEKRTSALRSGGGFFFCFGSFCIGGGGDDGITRIGLLCLFRPGFGGGG